MNSNNKSTTFILVSLVILLLTATWSFVNFQLDYGRHHEKNGYIYKLQYEASKLIHNILLVENGGVKHFDYVAKGELEIEKALAYLYDNDVEADVLVDEVGALLSNVSKIKSSYAVYLSSLLYFPKSADVLRGQLIKEVNTIKIIELDVLERDALLHASFNVNRDQAKKLLIQQRMKSFQNMGFGVDSYTVSLVQNFVKHMQSLLLHSEQVSTLNQSLLVNKVTELTQVLINSNNESFDQALVAAEVVKKWFYAALFLLAFVVIILWRTRQNIHKELLENAKMLNIGLKSAKQTQFSVNVKPRRVVLGKLYSSVFGFDSKEFDLSVDDWLSNIHVDDRAAIGITFNASLETGEPFELDYRWKSRDKTWLWVHTVGQTVEWDAHQLPIKIAGISTNVTERKRDEKVLRILAESNASKTYDTNIFQVVVKELALSQGVKYGFIARIDDENVNKVETLAVWANGDYSDNFSYNLIGTPCHDIVNYEGCFYPHSIQQNFPEDALLVELGVVSYMGVPLKDGNNNIIGLISIMDDKPMVESAKRRQLLSSLATRVESEIELEAVNHRLEHLAHYDALTGLPNRALLSDRFLQAKAHALRTHSLIAVCFVDLDDFKPVNDQYGHGVGDQLIIEVAERLKKSIRGDDTVSRLGGDEFIILLGEITSIAESKLLLDRVTETLSEPYKLVEDDIHISASIGFTMTSGGDDLDAMIRQADKAMYSAKQMGKNRYCLFDRDHAHQAIKKHQKLEDIKQALENDEMCLYYQPKVNMKTGVVYGVEALIRWQHPEKGLIPPFGFLPTIENTELEVDLGVWVIRQALMQLVTWKEAGITLEVSVNISSYHLLSVGFVEQLKDVLDEFAMADPENIQLEVLESSVIGDIELISNILKTCREELGVSIALDDFGTGYSSLAHLRHLPANVIKIDRSFVMDILVDNNDYAIVNGIISLATAFDLQVIAEGVETNDQGLMLLDLGCECAQGYGIALPMPANDIVDWLADYSPNAEWLEDKKITA